MSIFELSGQAKCVKNSTSVHGGQPFSINKLFCNRTLKGGSYHHSPFRGLEEGLAEAPGLKGPPPTVSAILGKGGEIMPALVGTPLQAIPPFSSPKSLEA